MISEGIVKAYAEEMKNIINNKKFDHNYSEIAEVSLHLSNNWSKPDDMADLLYDLVNSALVLAKDNTVNRERYILMCTLNDIINYGEVDLGVEE